MSENITVKRPWGYFTNLLEGNGFLTKVIHVNPNQKLSVQSHKHRSEHWVVLEGEATVLLDKKFFVLKAGESIDIEVNQIHSLQNLSSNDLKVLEVQRGELLSEEDIIRYEDMYGRV